MQLPAHGQELLLGDALLNIRVMPRLIASWVCFQLMVAFFQAPFFHMHEYAESDHVRHWHRAFIQTLHAHFPQLGNQSTSVPAPEIRDISDQNQAKFLSWFRAKPQENLVLLPCLTEPPIFFALIQFTESAPDPIYRTHDPHLLSRHSPRSPPFDSRLLRIL